MTDWPRIAAENGINSEAFRKRLAYGWTPERAATLPLRGYANPWLPKALANGINADTFYTRVRKLGWTPEKASSQPVEVVKRKKSLQPIKPPVYPQSLVHEAAQRWLRRRVA